jgi:hypothetical protein
MTIMYAMFTKSSKTSRRLAGWLAVLSFAPAFAHGAVDQGGEPAARLVVSASPANLFREENRQNPADAAFAQVYAGHLAELPVLIEVSIGLAGQQGQATLTRDGQSWSDQLVFRVLRDGRDCPACVLELLPGSDVITIPLDAAQGPFAVGTTLADRQLLESLWVLRVGGDAPPPVGSYEIFLTPRGGASGHFGAAAEFRCDMRFEVLPAGEADRMLENRIEGLFKTALAVRAFDPGRAAQHLDTAWALVTKFIADGAGDGGGLFNITPRYQAGRIAEALGRRLDALGYYSQVVQGVAKESKMRFGHFSRERGLLPQSYADHLVVRKINALRVAVEPAAGAAGR